MNYIDIILIILLAYGAYKGFTKGFVVEIATLLALVLGIYISVKFSGYMEKFLIDFFDINTKYIAYIALGVTFLLVVVAINLLGKAITALINMVSLGLFNKLLGFVLGFAKTLIMVAVILLIIDVADEKYHFLSESSKENSLLYNEIVEKSQEVYNSIRF